MQGHTCVTDKQTDVGCEKKKDISLGKIEKTYRVFIKYCVFRRFQNIFRTLASLGFPSLSVCVHNGR